MCKSLRMGIPGQSSAQAPGAQGASEGVPPAEPVSLLQRDAKGTRPARIIWLDDESKLIRAVSRLLPDYIKEYSLIACGDGNEALEEIARQAPDLLITDYHHPGARLDEILLRLEERPERFPILLVSACAGLQHLQELRALTSTTFTIEFPGDPTCVEALAASIRKHLCFATGPLPDQEQVKPA